MENLVWILLFALLVTACVLAVKIAQCHVLIDKIDRAKTMADRYERLAGANPKLGAAFYWAVANEIRDALNIRNK